MSRQKTEDRAKMTAVLDVDFRLYNHSEWYHLVMVTGKSTFYGLVNELDSNFYCTASLTTKTRQHA